MTDPVASATTPTAGSTSSRCGDIPTPRSTPTGNVTLLTDTDGDGRFDSKTIFVDGLSWPTGVVPYDGGVFIAVAPDILYAKDTDGDGVADVTEGDVHGLRHPERAGARQRPALGPRRLDLRVGGSNGGEIRNLAQPDAKPVLGPRPRLPVQARRLGLRGDLRRRPVRPCLDDWGHRFICNNSNHIRQIVLPAEAVDRNPFYTPWAVLTDIAVEGGAAPVFRISPPEPWRVVRTRQRAADPAMVEATRRRPSCSRPASSPRPPA